MTDAPRTDLTAADWAAMRRLITETARDHSGIIGVWDINSLKPEALAQLRQRHEREFVYARDFDAALDALARQQEANARLTEQNDALQEAAGESCHVCEYEWDNEWATVSTDRSRSVVCAKCWDGSTALARALTAEAALADRDATIARLREAVAEIDSLHAKASALRHEYLRWVQGPTVAPDEPFLAALDTFTDALREWVGDQNRAHRKAKALTPAKEADRG
jgi:hypothetical protein